MNAFKCDMCGGISLLPRYTNLAPMAIYDYEDEQESVDSYDICEKCRKKVLSFIKNSVFDINPNPFKIEDGDD